MLKILHNPRCPKSREVLEYLKQKTSDFEIIDYLKVGLSSGLLEEILLKTNLEPQKLVRTREEIFVKELKGKNFTREEWLHILLENPKLLFRPIIISKHKAVLAHTPETINCLL